MLVAKLGPQGHGGFVSSVMPITQSQIIPVGPLSRPPPPPVDASGPDSPPPLPIGLDPPYSLELTREDQLSAQPRWRSALAVTVLKARLAAQAVGRGVVLRGREVALWGRGVATSPRLGRARLRLSMWWLMAAGWVVNQASRLPKLQFALARREQSAASTVAMALTDRGARPKDIVALRELERRLKTLLAQLDVQRIAGTDNTPNAAGAIVVPRAPVDVVEIGGRVVGIIERGL